MPAVPVIVKIGTSSLTDEAGHVRVAAIDKLCDEVATARAAGRMVVLVTSGAITAGLPALGFVGERPKDPRTLQAASAVGQSRLMGLYEASLGRHGLVSGQVLMSPFDFFERSQYLHARGTLERLLELGVVPVINENDAVADDAIRFGDNDRIAALVAHLVAAERLVLLTDMAGIYTADPRADAGATLVAEIASIESVDGIEVSGAGTARGSGGMASKLSAARMAAWSGVTTVIASAERPHVLADAMAETPGVGTIVRPHAHPLSARKLWIAFAVEAQGRVHIDAGAAQALTTAGGSLLAVGVREVAGRFGRGDAIDVFDADDRHIARGLAAMTHEQLDVVKGVRNKDQPSGVPDEVIHRDELVVLV